MSKLQSKLNPVYILFIILIAILSYFALKNNKKSSTLQEQIDLNNKLIKEQDSIIKVYTLKKNLISVERKKIVINKNLDKIKDLENKLYELQNQHITLKDSVFVDNSTEELINFFKNIDK